MLVPGNRLIPLSRLWPEKSCRRASPASADFTFKGTDYLRYTKRLLDLQRDCQMEDLGRVDSTVWGRGETVASTIATVARRGVVGSK